MAVKALLEAGGMRSDLVALQKAVSWEVEGYLQALDLLETNCSDLDRLLPSTPNL